MSICKLRWSICRPDLAEERQRFPEAMLRICPGYPARRLPPGSRLTPYPGYPARRLPPRVAADALPGLPKRRPHVPVARARRFAPPPGAERGVAEFPGGDAAHLSGYPARRLPPGSRLTPYPGYACRVVCALLREFIQHPDKLGNEAILVIVPGHGFHQLQIANLSNHQLRGIINGTEMAADNVRRNDLLFGITE